MPKIQRPPPGASSWNVDPESIVSLRDEQLSVRPSATVRDLEALIANHELDEVRVLSLATDTLDRVPENLGQLPRLEEIVINRCVAPREPKRPLAFSPGLWGCSRLKTLEISEGEDQPLETAGSPACPTR
jgi:hypothetical protein